MELVSLHVPESVPKDFLNMASLLVQLVPEPIKPYAFFDRTDTCACPTRNALAIQGRSILVRHHQHMLLGFPLYALPSDCTVEETYVIVTWLFRHRLKTFQSTIVNGSLKRTLGNRTLFQKTPHGECCVRYTLLKDPVFMLQSIVLSLYGKGPNLESVCRLNKVS